jgi:uncharacterized protein (TIGR02996 family)
MEPAMNHEADFLAMIRTVPDDLAPRLVYADWLDENDDARGELIRIIEEMRGLPVFSERYWQLRPRYNELRKNVAASWLEAMRYAPYPPFIFAHGIPDGWQERWRQIRVYAEEWWQQSLGYVAGLAQEIEQIERELNRTLPSSLCEWIAFTGEVQRNPSPHIQHGHYELLELEELQALSILADVENDCRWAIFYSDWHLDDPPVYGFRVDDENHHYDQLIRDPRGSMMPTLSAFALDYLLRSTRGAGGFGVEVAELKPLIRQLSATFSSSCPFGQMTLFEHENILVRINSQLDLGRFPLEVEVATRTPREALPAFLWEYAQENEGTFHGMFAHEHLGEDEEIPF